MDHFELVEKLRERTNVSYEEAKAALEVNDWDLLDALVYLESRGNAKREGDASYTTKQREPVRHKPLSDKEQAKGYVQRIWMFLKSLIDKGNKTMFQLYYNSKKMVEIPVTALVVLLVVFFPWSVILLIVAMFFGVRYKVYGNADQGKNVNAWMDKAADVVENIKYGNDNSDNN